ncbi:glutathione peroxidase [Flocculibacter collagenilyticus]|uniref:glutathione peroxidase n=1 Tax=Flocculibacter collagenilyticus TaxID=2744479 RepID=UPI0018F561D6|nr:glutathione peroxidase [Flocculibacter collagenilyticus]
MSNLYTHSAKLNNGETISFDQFKDKVLLIVNTASKCGFTPQYKELQALYAQYKDKGLEILAFPCDQFGKQEPGNDNDIQQFCDLTFNISFPLFSKVEVNGDDAHPVYQFLKNEKKGILGSRSIKWNFTKFLVNTNGEVVERYAPTTKPNDIEQDIVKLLP